MRRFTQRSIAATKKNSPQEKQRGEDASWALTVSRLTEHARCVRSQENSGENPFQPAKDFWLHSTLVLQRKRLEQLLDLALAVCESVEMHPCHIEQRQVKIGQRRRFRILDVTPSLDPACSAAGDKDRQVYVVMLVGIAHAAAIQVGRMVQQGTVAVR